MVAVDTNVIVRLLVNDEPKQVRKAAALFETETIFVSKTALLETEWVLRYCYDLDSEAILRGLRSLAALPNVTLECESDITIAFNWFERGLDFADALHLASSRSARRFVTFDRPLRNAAKRLTSISITEP